MLPYYQFTSDTARRMIMRAIEDKACSYISLDRPGTASPRGDSVSVRVAPTSTGHGVKLHHVDTAGGMVVASTILAIDKETLSDFRTGAETARTCAIVGALVGFADASQNSQRGAL